MTYRDLKLFLETLSEEQLNQDVHVVREDEYAGKLEEGVMSDEDIYWDHGDCLGDLKTAKETVEGWGKKWEEEAEEFTITPKGTVTLHTV